MWGLWAMTVVTPAKIGHRLGVVTERIERRLVELGLRLPEPMLLPPGVTLPFPFVRVHGDRAYVSGHGPLLPDGSLAGPFGKVGDQVTPEEPDPVTGRRRDTCVYHGAPDADRSATGKHRGRHIATPPANKPPTKNNVEIMPAVPA